jgi:hypothetical protein
MILTNLALLQVEGAAQLLQGAGAGPDVLLGLDHLHDLQHKLEIVVVEAFSRTAWSSGSSGTSLVGLEHLGPGAELLGRLGVTGRALVVAVPLLWLLVFFLIPFLVVAKISLSEAAIAMPPYLPLIEWDGDIANLSLNFGNFRYLFDDPLYLNAYISSIRIAFVSEVHAQL